MEKMSIRNNVFILCEGGFGLAYIDHGTRYVTMPFHLLDIIEKEYCHIIHNAELLTTEGFMFTYYNKTENYETINNWSHNKYKTRNFSVPNYLKN